MHRRRRQKVKLLSVSFALLALAVLGGIFMFVVSSQNSASEFLRLAVDVVGNKFKNFVYKAYDARGKEVTLASSDVTEVKKDDYVLRNISSSFQLSDTERGSITSDITKINKVDKTICEFLGNVQFVTTSGLRLNTEKSIVNFDKKTAIGDVEIAIRKDKSELLANCYNIDIGNNIVTLLGTVRGFSEGKSIFCDKMILCFREKSSMEFIGSNDSIKSMDAIGNAKLVSLDYTLSANHILYHQSVLTASTNVNLIYKNNEKTFDVKAEHMTAELDKSGKVEEIKAHQSLTIKYQNATIRADSGVLKGNKVTVRGNVAISNANGDVFGDVAVLDVDTGDVSISKSSGVINDGKAQ
ncbi:MAG: LPS export ABC transporter periplasmic protein LptC [Holosporaceae bacterium]|nr:LPS export ABC transporter periplasmic protein LptC [Holosporaceae bacterium]